MSELSKTAAAKTLQGYAERIAAIGSDLDRASYAVGSLQLRMGIVLAHVKATLKLRDDLPTLKEWTARNVKGRSYATLSRWSVAGSVAVVLGLTDEDPTLPTVEEMTPLNRVLSKDPKNGPDRIKAIWAKAQETEDRRADAVVAGVNRSVGRPKKKTPAANQGEGDGGEVTIDLAAIEASAEDVKKTLKNMTRSLREKYGKDLDETLVLSIRTQTLRLVREHGIDAVTLAVLGSLKNEK